MKELFEDVRAWANGTFPVGRPVGGPVAHLRKECDEILATGCRDLVEYADALILICDGTQLAGFTCEDLLEAARWKMERNKRRRWGPVQADGVIEHLRDEEEGAA